MSILCSNASKEMKAITELKKSDTFSQQGIGFLRSVEMRLARFSPNSGVTVWLVLGPCFMFSMADRR